MSDADDTTVGDLYSVLQHDDPSNETKLVVEIVGDDGGSEEIPVRAIHWSKTSWGDDKLIFDTTL